MQVLPKIMLAGLAVSMLASCGPSQQNNQTAGLDTPVEILMGASLSSREEVINGQIYFISANILRVRSSDEIGNNIVGNLAANDKVRVVNAGANFRDKFVQIEVVSTRATIEAAARYFVSFEFLSKTQVNNDRFKGKYFMVQNIASEKLRVYERVCADNSCPHKMVLETTVAVGEDTPGETTNVGSYQISAWRKFYQDHAKKYPSWYDPTFPDVPPPGRGFTSWLMKKYMPKVNGKPAGEMRGAFGWYTALVEPNHHAQWTHGTVGWGEDKQRFIDKTKRVLPNLFTSPRSHGCTRTDNETIAYLRQILPVGTPLVKIYAIEDLADPTLIGYTPIPKQWDYIMTKRGVRVDGQKADRVEVLASGISHDEIIEEGSYTVNQWPQAVKFVPGEDVGNFRRKLGKGGNVYGMPAREMSGVFYVDTGLLLNYNHPPSIGVGGFPDEVTPSFMDATKVGQ